jgi:hypothetical protein
MVGDCLDFVTQVLLNCPPMATVTGAMSPQSDDVTCEKVPNHLAPIRFWILVRWVTACGRREASLSRQHETAGSKSPAVAELDAAGPIRGHSMWVA